MSLESVIKAVRDHLATNLPAALTAREAGPPAMTLPVPFALYEFAPDAVQDSWPVVIIVPGGATVPDERLTGTHRLGHEVMVVSEFRDDDPGTAQRGADRYADACKALVLQTALANNAPIFNVRFSGITREDLARDGHGTFIQVSTVHVEAWESQSYGS